MGNQHYNISDFVRGQKDCKEGEPHKPGQSESYDAGYSSQYELDQINDHRSMNHGLEATK